MKIVSYCSKWKLKQHFNHTKRAQTLKEVNRYSVHVADASSTKRHISWTVEFDDGWKVFYSSVKPVKFFPGGEECLYHLKWVVQLEGKVCMLRLKLWDRSLCLLRVLGANAIALCQEFAEEVTDPLRHVKPNKYTILFGDFNVHVGNDAGA